MFETREEFESYLANPESAQKREAAARRPRIKIGISIPIFLVCGVGYLFLTGNGPVRDGARMKALSWVVSVCGGDPNEFPLTRTDGPDIRDVNVRPLVLDPEHSVNTAD